MENATFEREYSAVALLTVNTAEDIILYSQWSETKICSLFSFWLVQKF